VAVHYFAPKYSQSTIAQLKSFSEKLRGKGAVKIAILNWAIFNAIVGNTDTHLKNLSCLVTPNGFIRLPNDFVNLRLEDDSMFNILRKKILLSNILNILLICKFINF